MATLQGITLEQLKEAMQESVRAENKELVKRMDAVEAHAVDTKRLLTETMDRVTALENRGTSTAPGSASSVGSTRASIRCVDGAKNAGLLASSACRIRRNTSRRSFAREFSRSAPIRADPANAR